MVKAKGALFRKYLWTNTIISLLTFLIIVSIIFTFVTDYWKNEKEEIFMENAHYVSNLVGDNSYVQGDNIVWINGDAVKMFMDTLSSSMKIDIFVTDAKGNIIISSVYNKSEFQGESIPKEFLDKISSGGRYSGTSDLSSVYKSDQYVIGEGVYSYGGNDTMIGAVFTAMNPGFLTSFKQDILKLFLITFLVAFLFAFWIARKLSYSMVKPLNQIAEAASCVARGDFSKRVQVIGQDEIADLGNAFNNMAESLDASESVRRNFVANVSHELKTPMMTITGFIDGILDGVIKDENKTKYLKIVSSEIKRLSRLVKRMIDLSCIENEKVKVNLSEVDIFAELLDVLLFFEQKISDKKIEVKGVDSCSRVFLQADKDMIHQALYNLVENAVKFTNKKGYIKVKLSEDNEFCKLSIENTGQSIDPDEIKFIFDRFYKTDKSRSEDKTGIGLGLYIVKKIVLLHGGEIKAESSEKSTVFLLALPKKKL